MRVRGSAGRRRPAAALAGLFVIAGLVAAGCGGSSGASAEPTVSAAGGEPACPHVSYERQRRRGGLVFGLNSVWNNRCNLAAIAAAGVTMERIEIGWPQVEPSQGHWRWRYFDRQFATAARAHIRMLPLLLAVPGWAGTAEFTLPIRTSGFAGYVARVVARYGPHGSFWRKHRHLPHLPPKWFEVWNEPYYTQFSSNGIRPDLYAQLYKSAVIAGRRADPAARFLIEADTTGVEADGHYIPWVASMYSAVPNLNRYIDGVAVHPYSAPRSPLEYTPRSNTRFQFRRIEQVHRQFLAHGARGRPFWITEVGWSTCPSNPEACVSEAKQAQYTRQVIGLVKKNYRSWVRALFIYNYRDSPESTDPSDKERWFGLIRRDGSPKPAWRALRAGIRK